MFAMRLHAHHTPLVWEELPDPMPSTGEIRVKVLACGVCRQNCHLVMGKWPPQPRPIVRGLEITGRTGTGQRRCGEEVRSSGAPDPLKKKQTRPWAR